MTNGTETRATVLGKIAENQTFIDQKYNEVFVLSLYFDYLRRNPENGGFLFWLAKINSYPPKDFNGQHALVCSFITSLEYQERFSSAVTRTNAMCAP